jgi:hypothetical protein
LAALRSSPLSISDWLSKGSAPAVSAVRNSALAPVLRAVATIEGAAEVTPLCENSYEATATTVPPAAATPRWIAAFPSSPAAFLSWTIITWFLPWRTA